MNTVPNTAGTQGAASHIVAMPKRLTTYVAIALWGAMAFTAAPTFGSFVVHFLVVPPVLLLLIFLARWEARRWR